MEQINIEMGKTGRDACLSLIRYISDNHCVIVDVVDGYLMQALHSGMIEEAMVTINGVWDSWRENDLTWIASRKLAHLVEIAPDGRLKWIGEKKGQLCEILAADQTGAWMEA